MDRVKIINLINKFKEIERPSSPDNKELEDIWDAIMLDFSDYIHWERLYLEKKLNENHLNEIKQKLNLSTIYITNKLKKFIPHTELEIKQKEEIKRFNDVMSTIMKYMVK